MIGKSLQPPTITTMGPTIKLNLQIDKEEISMPMLKILGVKIQVLHKGWQLGGFLGTMGHDVWSNAHGIVLTGLLQLANGNENGIVAALGYNNRSNWISQNTRWPT